MKFNLQRCNCEIGSKCINTTWKRLTNTQTHMNKDTDTHTTIHCNNPLAWKSRNKKKASQALTFTHKNTYSRSLKNSRYAMKEWERQSGKVTDVQKTKISLVLYFVFLTDVTIYHKIVLLCLFIFVFDCFRLFWLLVFVVGTSSDACSSADLYGFRNW